MKANGHEGEGITSWTVADTKSLTVRAEQNAETLVATVAGRVDGNNARELQDALESLLDKNFTAFVFDLEHLTYISSAGLRAILLVSKRLQERTAMFGICSLSSSISEIFQVSGFDKIIPVYATPASALSAFNS
jgi:anti-anti-sigma factor